jgi:hypothetical protein
MVFWDIKEVLNDYQGVKWELVKYLSENKANIQKTADGESLKIDLAGYSPKLVQKAIDSYIW